MPLKRLSIQNLRNLDGVDISPSEQVNLIFGANGSGKTSILEAINILGLGRSFRSHKHKPLINYAHNSFTVFGKVAAQGSEVPIGVSRQANGDAIFKANGATVNSAAALASYFPIQIINSDSFLLLEGSPKIRRQFIDWLVFHVEPNFYQVWKDSQRCLKHRNSLLRHDRIDRFELATWDQELVSVTEKIHRYREECTAHFQSTFNDLISEFISLDGLTLDYFRGWDRGTEYAEVLVGAFDRDRHQGFTRMGSHRADLRISINGQNAADILSRGQQKLLVCALKIAQGCVFAKMTGRKCIYLIDDLPAELDEQHRKLLAYWLNTMNTQVFVTGVERAALVATWQDIPEADLKLFHVEQGKVTPVTTE